MKKIGIDARLYSQTGVGTYLKNLIHYLDLEKPGQELFYLYLMPGDFDKVKVNNKNIIKRKADFRWHTVSEQIGFLFTLLKDRLDLMHFTYFSYPVLYRRKFVATVHDTTPLVFKTGRASTKNGLIYSLKHFFFRLILKNQVNRALKIITPTEVVKKELADIYGEKLVKKIVAIHEGVSYGILDKSKSMGTRKIAGDFFLYVGNFYPHKNVEAMVNVFGKMKTGIKLVLVGPDDYFTKRLSSKIGNDKKFLIIKNPPTEDLVYFYKHALALIHPSFSEGFGLPILEAAYFGCPIIASDIPVFKELLGSEYLSFDPRSPQDMERKLNLFIEKRPAFDYKEVMKTFSFKKMTAETLKIYRGLSA